MPGEVMALATTCPQCKTSFRVVPDQLKLRRGFVRCGRCHNVFAGIDHLRYVGDAQLRAESMQDIARESEPDTASDNDPHTASDIAPGTASDIAPGTADDIASGDASEHVPHLLLARKADTPSEDESDADQGRESTFAREPEPDAFFVDAGALDLDEAQHREGEAQHREGADDDVEWIVVGAPAHDARSLDAAPDAQAIDAAAGVAPVADATSVDAAFGDMPAVTPAPAHDEPEAPPPYVERFGASTFDDDNGAGADESAIDYFSTKRSRGFADRRGLAFGLLALALAVALALQWVVAQRSAIAARLPFVAPLLGATLAPFGLRIEPPRELDALTIESFELQASGVPDLLEMRALLRNGADHAVRWPSMQLTLTDPASGVLVRRSLHPADYLPEADELRPEGIPARTEWPLRLALEASDLQPAGYDYRVRLFYP